jgi:hypothetical protein
MSTQSALGPRITRQQVREWMLGDAYVSLMSKLERYLEEFVKSGDLTPFGPSSEVSFRIKGAKPFWDLAHAKGEGMNISYGLPENTVHAPGMLMMAIYHRLDESCFTVDNATIFHYTDGLGFKDEYTFTCTIKTTA